MTPRSVELTAAALADLDSLFDYIAAGNPRAAATILRALNASMNRLIEQPRLGRSYRHRNRRLRVLVQDRYLIFYRERPDVIEVVRVLDGRRHVPDLLDDW